MESKDLSYIHTSCIITHNIERKIWEMHLLAAATTLQTQAECQLFYTKNTTDFLPRKIKLKNEHLYFKFCVDQQFLPWSQSRQLIKVDKLRLLLNIFKYTQYIDSRYTCILDPINLYFDDNLIPIMMYHGLADQVPPFTFTQSDFLLQCKSLIIATLNHKYTYHSLYQGNLYLIKEEKFFQTIIQADSVDKLEEIINIEYQKEKQKQQLTMCLVKKKKHFWYRRIAYSSSVFLVLVLGMLSYQLFSIAPYQQQLFKATEAFFIGDYNGTIQVLNKKEMTQLPKFTQYQLAYAYVQNEPLSKEQKNVVLNSLSIKNSDTYLFFWIAIGKGEYDAALDMAKSLDDIELLIYATHKKLDVLNDNTTLSGADKESQRQELVNQLEQYQQLFEERIMLPIEEEQTVVIEQTTQY